MIRRPPRSTLFPYTDALPICPDEGRPSAAAGGFRRSATRCSCRVGLLRRPAELGAVAQQDRKSTRLNSSHANISYAVFCLKKKTLRTDLLGVLSFSS